MEVKTKRKAGLSTFAVLLAVCLSAPAWAGSPPPKAAPTVELPKETTPAAAPPVAPPAKTDEPADDIFGPPVARPAKRSESAKTDAAGATDSATAEQKWVKSLEEARHAAVVSHKPLLIIASGSSCPWCRKLEQEIAKPEVQRALQQWTLVSIDVDEASDDARKLNVSVIPALRIQTSTGSDVASQDGYLSGDDLIKWLEENMEGAKATADELLVSSQPPSALEIVRLARHFADRDPTSREAALRRLRPYAALARGHVVGQLHSGSLSVRLSALELLREWRAPLAGLDPWQPETLTKERLAAIDQWAQTPLPSSGQEDGGHPLTPKELEEARQEIARMLKTDAPTAAAIRHRLSRHGKFLLAEVYARLPQAATDEQRERLLGLRYALVADGSLPLRWPDGIERLASGDQQARHKAIGELESLAVAEDQPLLLELFSDTDPLVREVALRALQKVGGKEATAALVRLLDDPDPNVRAAVLKQLSESPVPGLTDKVAAYLAKEKDPDLIVHAIRCLREAKNPAALKSLIAVSTHEDWRVRAEATEAIGKLQPEERYPGTIAPAVNPAAIDARKALLARLDDPEGFVVSRALEALPPDALSSSVDTLLKVAKTHPELTLPVVKALVRSNAPKAKIQQELRVFARSKETGIRSAAVQGLVLVADEQVSKDLAAALRDPSPEVRLAAASAAFATLSERRRPPDENQGTLQLSGSGSTRYVAPQWDVLGATTKAVSQAIDATNPKKNPPSAEDEDILFNGHDEKKEAKKDKKPAAASPEKKQAPEKSLTPAKTPVPEAKPVPATQPPAKEKPPAAVEAAAPAPLIVAPGDIAAPGLIPAPAPAPFEPRSNEPIFIDSNDADARPAAKAPEESAWTRWILKQRAAGPAEPWAVALIPPLKEMLASKDARQQVAAGRLLVLLGQMEGLEPLLNAVTRDPSTFNEAITVMPLLVWSEQSAAFRRFEPLTAKDNHRLAMLAAVMSSSGPADARNIPLLWSMLDRENLSEEPAGVIFRGLQTSYHLDNYRYGNSPMPAATLKAVMADAERYVKSGPELRRLMALTLMTQVDKEKAAKTAREIADNTGETKQLRRDAFQIMLGTLPQDAAQKDAFAALQSQDVERQRISLRLLALGPNEIGTLRNRFSYSQFVYTSSLDSDSRRLDPPKGLTREMILPLLRNNDREVAAQAGYLLALLGDASGMPALVDHWRKQGEDDSDLSNLVVRAIAATDNAQYTPLLSTIYKKMRPYSVSDFYWTIRGMKQPEAVQLRALIRREHGAESLQ